MNTETIVERMEALRQIKELAIKNGEFELAALTRDKEKALYAEWLKETEAQGTITVQRAIETYFEVPIKYAHSVSEFLFALGVDCIATPHGKLVAFQVKKINL